MYVNQMSQHQRHARRGTARAPFKLSPTAALIGALAWAHGHAAWAQAAQDPAAANAPAAAASEADKEQQLESVTVRGRNRLEKLKDVPLAESVVSGAELSRELANNISSITKRLAGVSFNQNNTRGAGVSIRGLGKRSFAETQDPSVLLIVDDVSYGLSQLGNFDFYDIDSASVTRGPSGTAGGKDSSAGVVTIRSKQPSFVPSSTFALTYGQRQTVIGDAAVGGPIIDDLLAWRGAFHVARGSGSYTNSFNERGYVTQYNKDRVAGRAQFLLTPRSDLRITASYELEPYTNQLENGLSEYVAEPDFYPTSPTKSTDPTGTLNRGKTALYGHYNATGVFVGPRDWFSNRGFTYADYINSTTRSGTTNFDAYQGQTVNYQGGSLKVDWDVAGHTLTSITASRNYGFDAWNDEGTPFDVSKWGGGSVHYDQFSQELRLASAPGGKLEYQTGLYYWAERNEVESRSGWGSDAGAWFASDAQYGVLARAAAAADIGTGRALLRDSLADLRRKTDTNIDNHATALYGQAKWTVTPKVSVTTGGRVWKENRSTSEAAYLISNGAGGGLNPEYTSRGFYLGGFNSNTSGDLTTNTAQQLALADQVAQKYFGVNYAALSTTQKAQVAAAKALRAAQIGAMINGVQSRYKQLLKTANISPSYKFDEEVTGYVSYQYGQKPGTPLNINGVPSEVKREHTNAFEVGLKNSLLDKTLQLNANLFRMNIANYQQTVRVIDDFATAANGAITWASVQGNVEKVRAQGLELDAAYSGFSNLSLRGAATYNDARYKKFTNAAVPAELGYLTSPFLDQSGKQLSGAAKWQFAAGAEYQKQVLGDRVFHTSFNAQYITRVNNDEVLSDYAWVPAHATVDASIGLGTAKRAFDVTLIVKNLFNDKSHEQSWISYEPNPYPRWVGVQLSGNL